MSWLPLLPPLLALTLAIWKREVMLALLVALLVAELILRGPVMLASLQLFTSDPGANLLAAGSAVVQFLSAVPERLVAQFADAGNTRVLMFSLLIGALILYARESGGISAFVKWLEDKQWADTPRKASWMSILVSILLFIESTLSIFTAALVSTALFDRHKMSRARLAYFIDSTCPTIKVTLFFNGWGALLLGLLVPYGLDSNVQTLIHAIPLNFYIWFTLAFVFWTAATGKVYGPLRASEERAQVIAQTANNTLPPPTRKRYFLAPLLVAVFGIVFVMWQTGDGNLMKGSASSAVLWSVTAAVFTGYLLLFFGRVRSHGELVKMAFRGMGELLPMVTLVLLAFALGAAMKDLGLGKLIAHLVGDFLPYWAVAPLVFLTGCLISFSTGTSWGTFALMMPIAMPLAPVYGLPPELLLSAVIGGGVFGDHCSGISDTAIMSSLASGCDHYEHVKTQLPYALVAAGLTLVAYVITGVMMRGG